MIRGPDIEPNRAFRGVGVAILDNGREVHVDDIADSAEGQKIIDEIEVACLRIESQLFRRDGRPDWRKRATFALKCKRAVLARLQRRVSELRKAERLAASARATGQIVEPGDSKHRAFVEAAYEHLGLDECEDIWAHARRGQPALFDEKGIVE